jgi:hypothetical protein
MKGIAKNLLVSAVIAPLACLGLFGCGDGDTTSSAEAPLTKAQFLKQGDKICQEGLKEKDEAVKAALSESLSPSNKKSLQAARVELGEEVVSIYSTIADDLGNLTPPQKDEAVVKDILAKMEQGIEIGEAEPEKVAELALLGKARQAAESYGLSACIF